MIIGSISGVRPTATDRENSNATAQLWSRKPTMRNTAETMTTMNRIISHVKPLIPTSKLVSSRLRPSFSASEPK